jgi:hypothetical protein
MEASFQFRPWLMQSWSRASALGPGIIWYATYIS